MVFFQCGIFHVEPVLLLLLLGVRNGLSVSYRHAGNYTSDYRTFYKQKFPCLYSFNFIQFDTIRCSVLFILLPSVSFIS